jgi:hypothetical protein
LPGADAAGLGRDLVDRQEVGGQVVHYFGDHDPSGVHIDRNIERQLRELAPHAYISFERVAVRPEQIEEWGLLTRPTKQVRPLTTGRW